MHNNPCAGKWKLTEDITKYEHSSARFYISGKHAAYEVTDVEEIISEKLRQGPESAHHKAGPWDSGQEQVKNQENCDELYKNIIVNFDSEPNVL